MRFSESVTQLFVAGMIVALFAGFVIGFVTGQGLL